MDKESGTRKDSVNTPASGARAPKSHHMGTTDAKSHVDRVEMRIKDMHTRLQITTAQEDQWMKVSQVMRDNAKQMDALTKTRAEKNDMSALDDLKSYSEITEAHAAGMREFTPVFKTLYESMSELQKKNADVFFRHGTRKHS